ncbi:Fc.00g031160.m01.CDS01 [Cosmosporella sp. VM-42]
MVRTRAAGRSPGNERSTRHNPSRKSRLSNPPPVRRSKRSHPGIRSSMAISSDEDDSDSALTSLDDATGTDDDSDAGSVSDSHFRSRTRRPARAISKRKSKKTTGSRRSARQATVSRPQRQRNHVNVPQNSPSHKDNVQIQEDAKNTPQPSTKRSLESLPPDNFIPQGIIPDWQSPRIPYRAWTGIFYFAATSAGSDSLDVNWLINTATTCKAFSEAALTPIYQCPPISTFGKAKRLSLLLQQPPAETQFNYRAKIKSLLIDIQIIPQGLFFGLINPLPRLSEVIFFNRFDQPPYRQLDHPVRWQYSDTIFEALLPATESSSLESKPYPTVLRSWEWSGKLLGGHVPSIKDITRTHQEPSFAHLTKLSFTNFQVPSLHVLRPKASDDEAEQKLYEADGAVIEAVAQAISQLKSLKHLIFECSTVMNDRLLPLLPKDLLHLELINCWEVKSEDLKAFLHTHGNRLRTLTLSHNQSLDMAFLTELADACPKLEELRMNLSYFRHHDSLSLLNNDADPLYDQVLLPDQVPLWPASLRIIDFEHIRHWSVEAAEMFLQSLIDSAGNLPNLRHLAVKTMLNIPWKARANMRHEWRQKLDKVFLRPFVSPRNHTSLRAQQQQIAEEPAQPARKKRRAQSPEPSRRSGRIAQQHSDSDSRMSNSSKGLRSHRDRPLYKDPDTDEDEFDSEAEAEAEMSFESEDNEPSSQDQGVEQSEPVIQGLCKSVSIVFDNQKPTELQYGMEDFMNDETAESDEEWDGDEDEDDTVFVWR